MMTQGYRQVPWYYDGYPVIDDLSHSPEEYAHSIFKQHDHDQF
jgi:hypothetical protein